MKKTLHCILYSLSVVFMLSCKDNRPNTPASHYPELKDSSTYPKTDTLGNIKNKVSDNLEDANSYWQTIANYNTAIVSLGTVGQQHATHEKVKSFANKMKNIPMQVQKQLPVSFGKNLEIEAKIDQTLQEINSLATQSKSKEWDKNFVTTSVDYTSKFVQILSSLIPNISNTDEKMYFDQLLNEYKLLVEEGNALLKKDLG
ncbi:DUF4142 domain-containing protein [Myroides ceti]|uniref:DUF4142 domain-containing protein n=1 Tax=Paenimyroides ceti TaxID=395087 RepID=A0ABT8CNQ0_9FLAO|nr:DUF4142 domain-containing protein [Paenimyroides ceti]MDN3705791.1 DUF4142 domain-containing protein [Paenimyroides ceti]